MLREYRATLALYGVSGPQPVRPQINQPGGNMDDGVADVARHLLLARRLCEAGAGFVTVNGGSLQDVHNCGLQDNILLVIAGDFGRTPRINNKGGRDHWGTLCPLALAGGGLKMAQVVGESNPRDEAPKTMPIRPVDLFATMFHVLGLPQDTAYQQQQRPAYTDASQRPTHSRTGIVAYCDC